MPENSNLTRRTVVKGAAWTAPVVAAAVAVPAVAASDSVAPVISGCHQAGTGNDKNWYVKITIAMTGTAQQTLLPKKVTLTSLGTYKSNGQSVDTTTIFRTDSVTGTVITGGVVNLTNTTRTAIVYATVNGLAASELRLAHTGDASNGNPYVFTATCTVPH